MVCTSFYVWPLTELIILASHCLLSPVSFLATLCFSIAHSPNHQRNIATETGRLLLLHWILFVIIFFQYTWWSHCRFLSITTAAIGITIVIRVLCQIRKQLWLDTSIYWRLPSSSTLSGSNNVFVATTSTYSTLCSILEEASKTKLIFSKMLVSHISLTTVVPALLLTETETKPSIHTTSNNIVSTN